MDRFRRRVPPVDEIARVWIAFSAGLLVVAVSAYVIVDDLRPWLRETGGVTEGVTATTLLTAAIIGWWALRRTPHRSGPMWLVPALAALAFLDEIRWGVELFGFTPPMIGSEPIAGLADVADLAAGRIEDAGVSSVVVALAVWFAVAAAGVWLLRGSGHASRRRTLVERPWAIRLIAAGVVTSIASVLDLVAGDHMRFAEETMEMASAFLMTLAALSLPSTPAPLEKWRHRLGPWWEAEQTSHAA